MTKKLISVSHLKQICTNLASSLTVCVPSLKLTLIFFFILAFEHCPLCSLQVFKKYSFHSLQSFCCFICCQVLFVYSVILCHHCLTFTFSATPLQDINMTLFFVVFIVHPIFDCFFYTTVVSPQFYSFDVSAVYPQPCLLQSKPYQFQWCSRPSKFAQYYFQKPGVLHRFNMIRHSTNYFTEQITSHLNSVLLQCSY